MRIRTSLLFCVASFILTVGVFLTPVQSFAQNKQDNQQNSSFFSSVLGFASQVVTLNNPVQIKNPKDSFRAAETPTFNLSIPTKVKDKIGKQVNNKWKTSNESIQAQLVNRKTSVSIPVTIKKTDQGAFQLIAQKDDSWKPGDYHLQVDAKETSFYTRDLTHDFSWGVLSFNTNKSMYKPGETAHLAFGILDETGHTLCNATLTLNLTDPHGNKTTLSTTDNSIKKSPQCSGDSVTTEPDYFADYKTNDVGTYQMHLTGENKNGTHTLDDYFEVRSSIPFEVDRQSFPTRIYPVSKYDVKIAIRANENYSGVVTDEIPKAFKIENISGNGKVLSTETIKYSTPSADVLKQDAEAYKNIKNKSVLMYMDINSKSTLDKTPTPISWNVDWKAGQTYELSYTINFPQVSPEFYLIGPLTVGSFKEIRQWQIASDAVKIWQGNTSATWATASNWQNSTCTGSTTVAGSSDLATFDPSCSNNNANIAANLTVGGFNILSGYTGTITQSGSVTVTVGTQNYVQAGGTFTGGTGSFTNNGAFTLSGGSFTTTSGTTTMVRNFTVSGGTFTASSGTINFSPTVTRTINASVTVNNLYFTGNCGNTLNMTSGNTFVVNGTLTFDDNCGGKLNTGNITANGDINAINQGWWGTAIVTIGGTGTQTLTGDTLGGGNYPNLPSVVINKTSGTLNLANEFSFGGDFTYTSGTVSPGTSIIVFNRVNFNNNVYITGNSGNLTLANVSTTLGCGNTITFQSGNLIVTGTLTLDDNCSGYINGPGTIEAQGDVTSSREVNRGTVVITIDGTGSQTLSGDGLGGSVMIPSIVINKPSGTLSFANTFSPSNNWTYTAGTISPGTSTANFYDSGTDFTITGSMTFANISTNMGCGNTITIASGTTITTTGNVTLYDNCTGNLNGPGTLVIQGNLTASNTGNNGTVPITFTGTNNQTITQSTLAFPDGNWTINKPSGTVTLASALNLDGTGQNLTVTSGTFDLAGNNLTVNGGFTVGSSGTAKLQGGETITNGSNTISTGSTVEYTGAGIYTSLILGNSYYNLTISGSGSFTPSSSVTVGGNFNQSAGTFVAPLNLTIGGNFTESGTFTPGTGSVTFNDNTQTSTISGSNTFYNLVSQTAGKTIQFTAATTQTVTNSITIKSPSNTPIVLASTSSGSQWNINAPISQNIKSVNVSDSNACSGSTITANNSTNGGNNSCWTFTASNDWFNTAWSHRKRIVISHTKVASDMTNFPVMISFTDSLVGTYAQTNGNDIAFVLNGDSTKLSHEIEKYDNSTGTLVAWVNIPSLSSTQDTILYMYYGNSAASNQQDVAGTWSSDYTDVWHLSQSPTASAPQFSDSASSANNGTNQGSIASGGQVSGQIDGSILFNGSSQYISTANSYANPSTFTISAWFKTANGYGSGGVIMGFGNVQTGSSTNHDRKIWMSNTGTISFGVYDGTGQRIITSSSAYNDGNWHYAVAQISGAGEKLYMDGSLVASNASYTTAENYTGYWRIGHQSLSGNWVPVPSSEYFGGTIDEVRFYNGLALTQDQITTQYNNQSSPNSFTSITSSQQVPITIIHGGIKIRGGATIKY